MVNDTIADMLTRVRNANLARHQIVQVPATKFQDSEAVPDTVDKLFPLFLFLLETSFQWIESS